jgi:prophage antirepressor-like protein
MDIIKAFNNNNLHTEITIKGTYEKPLFRANDIGLILDIKYIHNSIKDFKDDEKVTHLMDTLGGQQKVTFLTAKGLYKTLFRSRKPIAETFQDWVCDVIEEIRLTGKYELENKIKYLEDELLKSKTKQVRRNYEFGETVYIIKQIGLNNVYKVGSSMNMNSRESTYNCCSMTSKVVYTRRCKNQKILEDNMHHKFIDYQYQNRRDWFKIDFETLRTKLDEFQLILDGKASSFTFNEDVLKMTIKDIDEEKENNSEKDTSNYKESTNEELKNITSKDYDKIPDSEFIYQNENDIIEKNEIQDTIGTSINPEIEVPHKITYNFDKFIKECFIIKKEAKTSILEIRSRYRIWSRNKEYVINPLEDYLKENNFDRCFVYDIETKCNGKGVEGLEMIPLEPFKLSSESTEIERFIFDTCIRNVSGRLTVKEISETFVEWKQKTDKDYVIYKHKDRKKINDYLNKEFLAAIVHDGRRTRFGYYGLSLKANKFIGKKVNMGNRKIIEQLHPDTDELIKTYDSLTICAAELKSSGSSISMAIKNKSIFKNFKFRVKD